MMAKAQVGDLIRLIKTIGYQIDAGEIFEVSRSIDGEVITTEGYRVSDYDYVIHRKVGEEDDLIQSISDAQLTQANRIRSACSELAELLVRKNHDYGDSFSQQYGKYGLMSALIRMDDKMRRLETLQQAESKAQVDESIGDTLLDLAGYALLTYVEQSKTK